MMHYAKTEIVFKKSDLQKSGPFALVTRSNCSWLSFIERWL